MVNSALLRSRKYVVALGVSFSVGVDGQYKQIKFIKTRNVNTDHLPFHSSIKQQLSITCIILLCQCSFLFLFIRDPSSNPGNDCIIMLNKKVTQSSLLIELGRAFKIPYFVRPKPSILQIFLDPDLQQNTRNSVVQKDLTCKDRTITKNIIHCSVLYSCIFLTGMSNWNLCQSFFPKVLKIHSMFANSQMSAH